MPVRLLGAQERNLDSPQLSARNLRKPGHLLAQRGCARQRCMHRAACEEERPGAFRRPLEDALLLGGRQRRVQRDESLAVPRRRAQLAVRQASLVQLGDFHQACRSTGSAPDRTNMSR